MPALAAQLLLLLLLTGQLPLAQKPPPYLAEVLYGVLSVFHKLQVSRWLAQEMQGRAAAAAAA
jgi:hypothetical protein